MQPDIPTPAALPPPIPAVATNTATGQQVGVDFAPALQAALQAALDDMVAQHPVVAALSRRRASRGHSDRTVLESSIIDVVVAVVAALVTIVSPDAPAVGVLWLATAVLASRTMIQAALTRFVPQGAVP
jgi:hypothetical protein